MRIVSKGYFVRSLFHYLISFIFLTSSVHAITFDPESSDLYMRIGADWSMSDRDVKKRYFLVLQEISPVDKNNPLEVARFEAVQEAWKVLGNKESKDAYDSEREGKNVERSKRFSEMAEGVELDYPPAPAKRDSLKKKLAEFHENLLRQNALDRFMLFCERILLYPFGNKNK